MSETHGTALILKRHEDFERVANYVKQLVREKSLELRGEDLSIDDKNVGLQIKEDENAIIWHDYGHHGNHLDFNPIAESVIKVFPDVEMERQGWWGPDVWNYFIVDGEWKKYTPWKFVAYAKGKGEEVLLEYKEMTDGLTDEEKREERNKICKELAEQHSRKLPDVEMAVYCYDLHDQICHTNEFYRAIDGCASHEHVDGGMVRLMDYDIDDMEDCIECVGQVLLYPMECAAEIIKRARKGERWYPIYAADMMLYGDTTNYFSLIEPSDKKWLMELAEESDNDAHAIYCLLFGMHHKYRYFYETFVDDDTKEEITVLRKETLEGSTFEKEEGEEERLIQKVLDPIMISHLSTEELTKLCYEIDDNQVLMMERIRRGEEEAAALIDDPAILQELCDNGNKYAAYELYYKHRWGDEANGFFINRKQAKHYYDLAGDIPFKEEWDDSDKPGSEYPSSYEYVLTGNADTLDSVQELINDLCQRFGIPENVEDGLGMYVPQRALMKVLVGSDTEYYRGNIQYLEREAPDRLVITTEADRGEPLLYALRESFSNLEIEIKETEW